MLYIHSNTETVLLQGETFRRTSLDPFVRTSSLATRDRSMRDAHIRERCDCLRIDWGFTAEDIVSGRGGRRSGGFRGGEASGAEEAQDHVGSPCSFVIQGQPTFSQ